MTLSCKLLIVPQTCPSPPTNTIQKMGGLSSPDMFPLLVVKCCYPGAGGPSLMTCTPDGFDQTIFQAELLEPKVNRALVLVTGMVSR